MTSAEKGLIWSAFIFALIAVLMVIVPYITTYLYAMGSKNSELGGMAFGMTFGLMMIAFGGFSWISSLIMLCVNAALNRPALKSKIGIATVIMNIFVLAYAGFFAWQIAKDLI